MDKFSTILPACSGGIVENKKATNCFTIDCLNDAESKRFVPTHRDDTVSHIHSFHRPMEMLPFTLIGNRPPTLNQLLNINPALPVFYLLFSFECFAPALVHFKIDQTPRSFGGGVFTHPVKMLAHTAIKIGTLTCIK
jgi:hypothetical protein